jgi:hypothetical protein
MDKSNLISPRRSIQNIKQLPAEQEQEEEEIFSDEEIDSENINSSPIISMRNRSPIRNKIEKEKEKEKVNIASPEPLQTKRKPLDAAYYTPRRISPIKKEDLPQQKESLSDKIYRLIENPNPDYNSLEDNERDLCYKQWKKKYDNLNDRYKDLELIYNSDDSLFDIHESYHNKIRDIYATNNSGMYEIIYIILICVMEFIFVNKLGFNNLQGYAKYEWKKIKKMRIFFIEYLATEYSYGTSEEYASENILWRFTKTYAISFILFLFTHTVIKYIGFGDSVKEELSNMIENKFFAPVTKDLIESGNIGERNDVEGESSLKNIVINTLVDKVNTFGASAKSTAENKNTSWKF